MDAVHEATGVRAYSMPLSPETMMELIDKRDGVPT
jgi:CO/xanthine dehydrogenase Mo-binding subunit